MDELSREYRILYVEQKEIVKERLIAVVVDSLDSLSDVVCGQLQCIGGSYRHLNALTGTQPNQELLHAQNVVQEAGRVYGQQLTSTLTQGLDSLNILQTATAGSVAFNQPTADVSIPVASRPVNDSISQINENNDDSDYDTMSVKSEINSDDECLSDSGSQTNVNDVKEEPDEAQTEIEINQTVDTATVKDEIVSSSECESDSDSDDYESDSTQVKEEDHEENEIPSNDNSNHQDPDDCPSIEESANIAQSNGNVETVNSNEGNNERQTDGMMMDDEENEENQDEQPSITLVNYEVEMQSLDKSNNQDSAPDGSFNEDGNERLSGQEVLDEQENNTQQNSIEPNQAGPSIVSNPTSTLIRRSARASAKKVNNSETIDNSLTGQQGTLQTGTRKRKRKTGRSGKSSAPKRSRVDPPSPVAAAGVDYDSQDDNEDPESEVISLSINIRRLNCRVSGCKKVFPSKMQLDGHLLAKHAIEKYACNVKDCTESYATRDELTTHRDSAHDNLGNEWPCGQCEVTCKNYHQLWTHTWYNHEYGLFACSADKCDFTEKTRIKVQNHQRKHRPAKYRCTYAGCSSSFNMKSRLTRHLRVHSKETPFLCSQCPKAFAQKIHLTRHERVHSGLKPYSCTWPHCDYSTSQRSHVIVHIRGVHFGLPRFKTEQKERGIIDNRDARLFVKKAATNGN